VNEHPSGRTLHVGLQFIMTMAREAGYTELRLTTGDVILIQQTPTQIIMQAEHRILGVVTK
jgi:hypothetical protein